MVMHRLAACVVVLASMNWIVHAKAADKPASVFLDCRSTVGDSDDYHCELILREIPRQEFLIAMEQDLAQGQRLPRCDP